MKLERRRARKPRPRGPYVAYDLETTPIEGRVTMLDRQDYEIALEQWERKRTVLFPGCLRREMYRGRTRGEFASIPARWFSSRGFTAAELATILTETMGVAYSEGDVFDELRCFAKPLLRDYVTTTIAGSGKPRPLYFTAFGADLKISRPIRSHRDLATILADEFLTIERVNTQYVAWNANRFDVRFVFEAIGNYLDEYVVRINATRSGAIRSVRVTHRDDDRLRWFFVDGMSVTGIQRRLSEFLATFAPELPKLADVIDFDAGEVFDARNPEHVAYADRDAEGLYVAMTRWRSQVRDLTARDPGSTIAGTGVTYLEASIPENVVVYEIPTRWERMLREHVVRGGYVHTERQYDGPVWAYDINQAYAAAMRDAGLPCGNPSRVRSWYDDRPGIYVCAISRAQRAPIPFYCSNVETEKPEFTRGDRVVKTALVSSEIAMLLEYGWNVEIIEGLVWHESFNLRDMVCDLETIRLSAGPKSPLGMCAKAIGNNAYGKTAESFGDQEIVVAKQCPGDEFLPWKPEDKDFASYWVRRTPPGSNARAYHKPQLSAFVTAHVRCVVYRAAMLDPEHFLKADTDSVAFSRPCDALPIDNGLYGFWKLEHDGTRGIVIGKKIYCMVHADGTISAVCKGIDPRRLTLTDYEQWLHTGKPPSISQTQLVGWRTTGNGIMYRTVVRRGTNVHAQQSPPRPYTQE